MSSGRLLCIKKVYLLEPLHKFSNKSAERLLRLAVVECALFVALHSSRVPIYDELVRKDTLVVHELHEGIEILLLTRLSFDEVEHYCLQKSLDTNLSVTLYEFHEG